MHVIRRVLKVKYRPYSLVFERLVSLIIQIGTNQLFKLNTYFNL